MSDAGTRPLLPTKPFGKTGLRVTTLGLGCGSLGRGATRVPDPELAVATAVAALDAGVRLLDTASLYLDGASERFVGEALRQRPQLAGQVVVETKVRDTREFGYSAAETRRSVETSLSRLGLEHIPVVFVHDPPASIFHRVMAADGALSELRRLQAEGVVGHVGIASNNPWDNAPYVETGEFEVAVVPDAYSLLTQVALERIFPAAEKFGMGIVVATPLERGLLATGVGAARWQDHANRSFTPESIAQVERIEALCRRHGVTLLAAALQFVARHPVVATTIPGARNPGELGANVDAVLQSVPEAFWRELQPMLRTFDVAVPPE